MPVQEIDLGKVVGPPGPPGADGAPGERGPGTNTNLLDNWYFADPINQRGKTEYAGAGYGLDRWHGRIYNQTVKVKDGYVEITAGVNQADLEQNIENMGELLGETVTLSALVRGDGTNAPNIGIMSNHPGSQGNTAGSPSTSWSLITTTVVIASAQATPRVFVSAGGTIGVKAIKLELGDTQTLAHQDADGNWVLSDPPPDKALELAKCQRYYLRADGNSGLFMLGVPSTGNNTLKLFVPTPVTMRVNPAVKISGSFVFDWSYDNGSTEPINYSGTAKAWRNGVWVNPGNSSRNFTDILFAIMTAQSEDGVVELSADL